MKQCSDLESVISPVLLLSLTWIDIGCLGAVLEYSTCDHFSSASTVRFALLQLRVIP